MSGLKKIRIEKVVSSLPGTLQADTVYFVKNNSTYDLYITNGVGTITSYPINKPIAAANLLGNVIIGNNINVASDGTISIPTAASDTPGVVKVGDRLEINNGILNFLVNTTEDYHQLSTYISYNDTVFKNEFSSAEKSIIYQGRTYLQSSGYIADTNPGSNYSSLSKISDNSRITISTNSNGLSNRFIETYYPVINTSHRILKITSYDDVSGSINLASIDWTNGSGLTLNEIAGNSILFQFNGSEVARIASTGTIITNNATIYLRRNSTDYAARRNWGFSTEQNATGDFQILESSTNTGIPINARFAILSGGNTGIGYVFPTQRLQVAGAVRITSNSNTLTELGVQLDFYDNGSTARLVSYKSTGSDLDFYVTNTSGSLTQLLHLDKTGNVGIACANPIMPLTIQNIHVNGQVNEVLTLNDPINPRSFNITKYDRVIGGYWNSDIRFNLNQSGVINSTVLQLSSNGSVDMSGNVSIGSLIPYTGNLIINSNSPGNRISFQINSVERAYVGTDGAFYSNVNNYLWGYLQTNFENHGWAIDANYVGSGYSWIGFSYAVNSPVIGTIVNFSQQNSYCFQLQGGYIDGNLYFRARNGDVGQNPANGWYSWNRVTLVGLSDTRLKDNWVPLQNSLENLLSLRTGRFKWNDLALTKGISNTTHPELGFVAQDFEAFLPELISDSGVKLDDSNQHSERYKHLYYDRVTVLIVSAFQEYVEKTEQRIKELEQKNQSILSKLFNFKKLW